VAEASPWERSPLRIAQRVTLARLVRVQATAPSVLWSSLMGSPVMVSVGTRGSRDIQLQLQFTDSTRPERQVRGAVLEMCHVRANRKQPSYQR
jgi:hypothetical protein